jgi:hypothetical protein
LLKPSNSKTSNDDSLATYECPPGRRAQAKQFAAATQHIQGVTANARVRTDIGGNSQRTAACAKWEKVNEQRCLAQAHGHEVATNGAAFMLP